MFPLAWYGLMAASIASWREALAAAAALAGSTAQDDLHSADHPRRWTTPHRVLAELATMRVLAFSRPGKGPVAILVAPFALHTSTTVDFAPSHSVVEALLAGGIGTVLVTDWRSAGPNERHFSIDTYLADLNVLVDDAGAPAALVGLCQGGWLSVAYAARFPAKVARLALVGAPIDIEAADSPLAEAVRSTPPAVLEEMVRLAGGVLPGRLLSGPWPIAGDARSDLRQFTQVDRPTRHLERRYRAWQDDLVDLPGPFYLQATNWIFRENRLARGGFTALGRRIRLGAITCPVLAVAAEHDEIVPPEQLFGVSRLIGTPAPQVSLAAVPGRHLTLFMGREVLSGTWPSIAAFLAQDGTSTAAPARAPRRRSSSARLASARG